VSGFLKKLYIELFKINDTPQRIAAGLGVGVFLGILPGTGPLAALFLAWLLRLNRASALLGSLFTNTWLSIVTLLLSVKVGAAIMGLNWKEVREAWMLFLKDFHWLDLLRLSALNIILPVVVGYLTVAFCLGLAVYLITWIILKAIT
jgi:uncharacterized protein (DUF2062 family)